MHKLSQNSKGGEFYLIRNCFINEKQCVVVYCHKLTFDMRAVKSCVLHNLVKYILLFLIHVNNFDERINSSAFKFSADNKLILSVKNLGYCPKFQHDLFELIIGKLILITNVKKLIKGLIMTLIGNVLSLLKKK